jgi:hypothetical protein
MHRQAPETMPRSGRRGRWASLMGLSRPCQRQSDAAALSGLNTNILLRLWPNDAPVQNQRIDALLAEHAARA